MIENMLIFGGIYLPVADQGLGKMTSVTEQRSLTCKTKAL